MGMQTINFDPRRQYLSRDADDADTLPA